MGDQAAKPPEAETQCRPQICLLFNIWKRKSHTYLCCLAKMTFNKSRAAALPVFVVALFMHSSVRRESFHAVVTVCNSYVFVTKPTGMWLRVP